jgi:bisanhydrobacterioruberin hydratase
MTPLIKKHKEVKAIRAVIFFHLVGTLGILLPFTSPFFITLTPWVMILSVALFFLFQEKIDIKTISVLSVIFVLGLLVEMVGVNSEAVFGDYHYGLRLGPKLFHTPVIMGLNWVLLICLTASAMESFRIPVVGKIILSSLLMVSYDVALEQIAPKMDMWTWQNNAVPLQNFIAWFIISLLFHSLIKIFKLPMKNSVGPVVLICQLVFLYGFAAISLLNA